MGEIIKFPKGRKNTPDMSVVDNKNREWEFTMKRARKISDPSLRAVAAAAKDVWEAADNLTPKVSKNGFKWRSIAKGAGKVATRLGGAGALIDLLTPPISNGKIHRHPIYDKIAKIPEKQKRNPYSNKVTLGIQ